MVLRQASIAIQPGGKGTAQTTAFNALLDRALGPVMRNVKVEHTHAVVELTDEERRARIKALADSLASSSGSMLICFCEYTVFTSSTCCRTIARSIRNLPFNQSTSLHFRARHSLMRHSNTKRKSCGHGSAPRGALSLRA